MSRQVKTVPELAPLRLINAAQRHVVKNLDRYTQTAVLITDRFYRLLLDKNLPIIGINHRLKSAESLKEKILRKKLYKGSRTPEQIIRKITDMIGVMIECEFISDEEKIFSCIRDTFPLSEDGVFFYNPQFPDMMVDLGTPQPVKQKNGYELYKLDCRYADENGEILFELQIKSLVNSFWCEVEHNIVYKNNHYISSDDYVNQMLSAVRINLAGLDRILQLISDRIGAMTAYNVVLDLRLNTSLTKQLVSDLINAKMVESVGFTMEAKRIRDLLAWYILEKLGPSDENSSAFFKLSGRFKELHQTEFRFDRQIELEYDLSSKNIFSRTVGGKMLQLMNSDFEWHVFFIMIFAIYAEQEPEEVFGEFIDTLNRIFCGGSYFKGLF
ncbi:MAG TPA: hypothetical protein VHR42_06785, partial [Clostridia bacterium]|nr:hypothetical protein [Clostridia bacterium]